MRGAQIVIERCLAFFIAHFDWPFGVLLQGFYRALSPTWITKQVPIIRQSISNDDSVTVSIPWSDFIFKFKHPPSIIRHVINFAHLRPVQMPAIEPTGQAETRAIGQPGGIDAAQIAAIPINPLSAAFDPLGDVVAEL